MIWLRAKGSVNECGTVKEKEESQRELEGFAEHGNATAPTCGQDKDCDQPSLPPINYSPTHSVCPWNTLTEWMDGSLKSHSLKVVSLEEVTTRRWVGWVQQWVSSWSCPANRHALVNRLKSKGLDINN